MSKANNVKVEVLKKAIARLIKAAPAKKPEPVDPLTRLVRAFLEYDCDEARTEIAEKKIQTNMVDFNELRVTPAIELSALLGVRYPFADSRCSGLHRALQSIFEREHQMKLDRLAEMKKNEVRPYLQSLAGMTPYVEAAVSVDCFGIVAAPMDTKLLLWLISKDALPEGMDIKTAQQQVEKHLKVSDCQDFARGARKEIDGWAPKSWPQVPKPGTPVLPANFAATTAAAAAAEARSAEVKLEEAKSRDNKDSKDSKDNKAKKPEVKAKDAKKVESSDKAKPAAKAKTPAKKKK